MTETHSVSYSEASSYLLCQRKWEYGYGRSLKRVTESHSLMLGSAVHAVLDAFYSSILSNGYDDEKLTATQIIRKQKAGWNVAVAAAEAKYLELVAEGFEDADNKASLREIVFDFYLNKSLKLEPFVLGGWRILAVEKEFVLDTVTDDGSIVRTPIVVDLIAVDPDGKTVVVDHKCLQDFYDYKTAEVQPQIPLYIAVLRGLKFKIDYGYYNMLRNRKITGKKLLKGELVEALDVNDGATPELAELKKMKVEDLETMAHAFGIVTATGATPEQRHLGLELKPNARRVGRTFLEQISVSEELIALGNLSETVRDLKMHRVANKMVCQSCSFYDLCTTELTGGNVPLMLRTEYVVRERRQFTEETTYGEDD